MLGHVQHGLNYQPAPKQDSFGTDHVPPPMMDASPAPTNLSISDSGVVMTMLDGISNVEGAKRR